MNVSTRKTIRTVYQALVAIAAMTSLAVPVFNMNFPKYAAVGGSILAAVAAFTKVQTALEQRGIIKKFLDPAKAPDAVPLPAPVVISAVPPATANPAGPLGPQPPTDGTSAGLSEIGIIVAAVIVALALGIIAHAAGWF